MNKLVLPKGSYQLMNLLFKVHNELGPSCKEKNYQDAIEILLKQKDISYKREEEVFLPFAGEKLKGFFVDFVIDNKIILEVKAKIFIKNEDVRQVLRYLKATGYPLAIITNFKRQKLEYKRVINADFNNSNIRDNREKFGSILGIDYGAKKIGLAKSDEANKIALPLEILINQNKEEILTRLKDLIAKHEIREIVVGVPVSLSNGDNRTFWRQKDLQNAQMKEVLGFITWLKDNIDLPIEIEDERLSTKMANGLRKDLIKKGPDDAVAAMLILQTYLDKLKKS